MFQSKNPSKYCLLLILIALTSRCIDAGRNESEYAHPGACRRMKSKLHSNINEYNNINNLMIQSKYGLPESWLWSNINNTNFLTTSRNQHIPQYCGSCWAFGATSAFSDRIKIARNASAPDVNIAPQVLLSCDLNDDGCSGGDGISAYEWIHLNNITDETCSVYRAKGWDDGANCTAEIKCMNCIPSQTNSSGECFSPASYYVYGVDSYGNVSGEINMMNEIFNRGPISCGIVAEPLFDYTGGIFIYRNETTPDMIGHEISIVGWGQENGTEYWMVRNSWGTYWGENGFFRIIKGVNNLQIETDCAWAVPSPYWVTNEKNYTKNTTNHIEIEETLSYKDIFLPSYHDEEAITKKALHKNCYIQNAQTRRQELVLSPRPHETLDFSFSTMPTQFEWSNVNGTNYLSWSKNQHIPNYCGSCWAQASTSSLADRFNIMNKGAYPLVDLNPQVMINCNAGGDCNGGYPIDVYYYANQYGIPDNTCQQYIAANPANESCSAIQQCMNCKWGPPPVNCWAVTDFPRYYASEYGYVVGVDNMKAEILRGPISCGIDATPEFEVYTGGIFSQVQAAPQINHIISVYGWGVDEKSGVQFWYGRNSWGSYWGEHGFFRILMGSNNLGIETDCSWGIPSLSKPT